MFSFFNKVINSTGNSTRESDGPATEKLPRGRKVLNVGGNSKKIPIPPQYDGWEHVLLDIDPKGNPDVVCDARNLTGLLGADYDSVYCSHNLEHYYRHDVEKVLAGFLHILKDDGFAYIRVPDMGELMQIVGQRGLDIDDFLYQAPCGPITVSDVIYGHGEEIEKSGNDFYAHKTGFTQKSLKATLLNAGFPFVFIRVGDLEISAIAFKRKPSDYAVALFNLSDALSTEPGQKLSTQADLLNESATHKRRGNEFLAKGMLEEAAECYRQAVAINPDYAEAYLNLGFVLREQKRYEEAERYLKQAVLINPAMEDAYYILGGISQERGNLDGAIENYNKTLELKPDFEIVYRDLCHVLFQSGQTENAKRVIEQGISLNPESAEFYYYLGNLHVYEKGLEQAIACYRKVLSIQPDYAEVHCLLGNLFKDQGDLDEAQDCYRRALALNPDDADAHNNLGAVFQDRGNLDEAQDCYRRALALNPDYVDAHNNLGSVFQARGNFDEAVTCYRKALALKPDSVEVNNNLGVVFKNQGNLNEAVACYRKAIALRPDFSEAYNNLGNVLKDQGNLDEAVVCYSKALMLKPDFPMAHNNLGIIFQEQDKLDKALACYRQALEWAPEFHVAKINLLHVLQYVCEWKELGLFSEEVRRVVREIPSTTENQIPPFSFLALSGTTPPEQRICANNWAQSTCQSLISRRGEMGFEFKREPNSKIHIGYFSADFRNHPVAYLMAEIFEIHDRDRFQITAYSYGPNDGGVMRKRLEKAFDNFVEFRDFTHENAARKIYEDHVDILVDLTGYTQHSRSAILALHPAPIQVGYLGYLGTMGADFMDYIIADSFLIPPEYKKYYSEKVAYLPSYQANDRRCAVAETPTRKGCGLPEEGVVFCCFNQTYKILPDVFDVWMRLLKAVQNSVFWVYASNPYAIESLRREAQARGVSPERLIFAENLPLDRHLARLKCADLFLDTLPYNAGTTASNALWAGLPVITCAGETFSSRMAGSLLTSMGVPELITYNLDDYYSLALDLATDGKKRENIRGKIIANRDSALLFDSRQFTRNLEAVYAQMWDEYVGLSVHTD